MLIRQRRCDIRGPRALERRVRRRSPDVSISVSFRSQPAARCHRVRAIGSCRRASDLRVSALTLTLDSWCCAPLAFERMLGCGLSAFAVVGRPAALAEGGSPGTRTGGRLVGASGFMCRLAAASSPVVVVAPRCRSGDPVHRIVGRAVGAIRGSHFAWARSRGACPPLRFRCQLTLSLSPERAGSP